MNGNRNQPNRNSPARPRYRALAAMLAVGLVLVTGAAGAHDKRVKGKHKHHDHGRKSSHVHHVVRGHRHVTRVDRVVVHHGPAFVAPRVIRTEARPRYTSYRHGRIYDPAHRHYHVVYSFPVYSSIGVTYRPYAYCGDRLHATGYFSYAGPRFSFQVGF